MTYLSLFMDRNYTTQNVAWSVPVQHILYMHSVKLSTLQLLYNKCSLARSQWNTCKCWKLCLQAVFIGGILMFTLLMWQNINIYIQILENPIRHIIDFQDVMASALNSRPVNTPICSHHLRNIHTEFLVLND